MKTKLGWNLVFIKKQSKVDFLVQFRMLKDLTFSFSLFSYLGYIRITCYSKLLLSKKNKFLINRNLLRQLKRNIYLSLYCLFFCWSLSFDLIGYNFELRKNVKKNIIKFDLGFSKQWILLTLPSSAFIYGKRRKFTVFLSDPYEFFFLINFLRNIRHIFPYKKRGLLLEKSPKIWMKPGKRTKYR